MRILEALLTLVILAPSLLAQSLSKQDLIDLKKAGVDNEVLIQQIQKDGIGFEMNAATTIELKNLGLSDEVLSALLNVKTSSAHAGTTQSDSVAALYRAGKFPELADSLKATIKANPADYRSRALLVMTLLKMKENDAAHAEFGQLASHEQDATAAPIVKQVRRLLETLAKNEEAKGKLLSALKDYQTTDAYAAVDQLSASQMQKGDSQDRPGRVPGKI